MKKSLLTIIVYGLYEWGAKKGQVNPASQARMQFVSEKTESVRQTIAKKLKWGGELPHYTIENVELLTE